MPIWKPFAMAMSVVALAISWNASGETSASRVERELLAAVNQARRAHGLAPLRWNEALAIAARGHAEMMAERGSAEHDFAGEPGLAGLLHGGAGAFSLV